MDNSKINVKRTSRNEGLLKAFSIGFECELFWTYKLYVVAKVDNRLLITIYNELKT